MSLGIRVVSIWNTRPAVVLAALVVTLSGCAPAAEEGEDADAGTEGAVDESVVAQQEEVDAFVDDFVAAWEREDAAAASGVFTADAVAFDPVPPGRFHLTEGIDAWINDTFTQLDNIDITLSERGVQTHGDVAWFESRYVFAARPAGEEGEPFSDEGYVTMVLVKQQDGSYAMPLFHASRLPEAELQEGAAEGAQEAPPADEG